MQFTKLNVGSRDELKPEPWLNIDLEPGKIRPNYIQMDVFDMPDDWKGQFEEIQAVHVLEHINRNRRQEFVERMFWACRPGGHVQIEVPNFPAIIARLAHAYATDDQKAQHIWTTSIYGKQRSPGDQHCWGFDQSTLCALFRTAGFYQIDFCTNSAEAPQIQNKLPMISSHWKQEPILLVRGTKPNR